MNTDQHILPKTVGVWTRPESPTLINSENIFEYMNGAGELYVGYRFQHLEVFDYLSKDQHNILVELYYMETPDDAFGLLSLDWGGESISFGKSSQNDNAQPYGSAPLALYGAGLLRIWSDNLYARVMAYRETPASKQAIFTLGKAICNNRQRALQPDLVNDIFPRIGSDWQIRYDRLSFFRSNLVLNSIYYLSGENILDIDLSTEALIATYENLKESEKPKRSQFLMVKYLNTERARVALNRFHGAYLPEFEMNTKTGSFHSEPSFYKLEDGWLGYRLLGKYLIIVFEGPDKESARKIIQKNASKISNKEDRS